MRASSPRLAARWRALLLASVACGCVPAIAVAQQVARGFAVERLLLAPPGSAWLVMDDLAQEGGLGAAAAFSVGYARLPLEVRSADGAQRLAVVEDQVTASVGLAITFDRFRLRGIFAGPVYGAGHGGTVDGWRYVAPGVNVGQRPDLLADLRVGLDARLLGDARDPLRLGIGLEVVVPSGARSDYVTDGTWRGIGRVLAAGGSRRFQWAGYAGAHLRPVDEPSPGSPRGSELLLGAAAGVVLPVGASSMLIGPEVHGGTAFRSILGGRTTAWEALLTASYGTAGPFQLKAGVGAGLDTAFGVPSWRAVLQVQTHGTMD